MHILSQSKQENSEDYAAFHRKRTFSEKHFFAVPWLFQISVVQIMYPKYLNLYRNKTGLRILGIIDVLGLRQEQKCDKTPNVP